jgi:hypothetical protein
MWLSPFLCDGVVEFPANGLCHGLTDENGRLAQRMKNGLGMLSPRDRLLTHAHVGVYNAVAQGVCMENLQRVNLLLEKRQRQALERLARQRNRSVSDLVREYITAGLKEDNSQQRERLLALEHAREISARILKRRKGKPLPDAVKVIENMREERVNELLGH